MAMQNSVRIPITEQNFNDDIIFSTFNLKFCNPCFLGLCAFSNSVKSRDSRLRGDFASAKSYGDQARRMNIAGVLIGFILFVVFIVYFIKAMNEMEYAQDQQNKHLS